jgi:hypothetical protein
MATTWRTVALLTCLLVASPAAWATTLTFTNSSPITLPSTSGGAATATAYPSEITVSGVPDTLQTVSVDINGWTDSSPGDIHFELVGPTGIGFEFLGGVGSSANAVNIELSDGGSLVGSSGPLVSGVFQPTVYSCITLPSLASPSCAATVGFATFENKFAGSNPNGTWGLYIYDPDTGDSAGTISDGWSLDLETSATPVPVPVPAPALLLFVGLSTLAGLQRKISRPVT